MIFENFRKLSATVHFLAQRIPAPGNPITISIVFISQNCASKVQNSGSSHDAITICAFRISTILFGFDCNGNLSFCNLLQITFANSLMFTILQQYHETRFKTMRIRNPRLTHFTFFKSLRLFKFSTLKLEFLFSSVFKFELAKLAVALVPSATVVALLP